MRAMRSPAPQTPHPLPRHCRGGLYVRPCHPTQNYRPRTLDFSHSLAMTASTRTTTVHCDECRCYRNQSGEPCLSLNAQESATNAMSPASIRVLRARLFRKFRRRQPLLQNRRRMWFDLAEQQAGVLAARMNDNGSRLKRLSWIDSDFQRDNATCAWRVADAEGTSLRS